MQMKGSEDEFTTVIGEEQKIIKEITNDNENSNLLAGKKIKLNIDSIKLSIITTNHKDIPDDEITIDDLMNKIGFNKYHYIIFIIVILSLISDGVELYLIYLIAPVLSYINNYPDSFISGVTSILFLGMAIGSISTGLITKCLLGRKNAVLFFITLITLFGTFCVSFNNIYWFVICRFIVGISIGYLFNIVNAFCEILPQKNRDFIIGSIYFAIKLGIIYFIFIFYIFSLRNDIIHSYKLIVIISSIPMIICWILAFLYFEESPRILLWNCEYKKAFAVIDLLSQGSSYDFNESEKNKIIKYIEHSLIKEYQHMKRKENLENNVSIKNFYKNEEEYAPCKENKYEVFINKEKDAADTNNSLIVKEQLSVEQMKDKILEHKKSWKNFSEIFKNKKLILTILVCSLWILNTFAIITNLYSLPIILANQRKVIQDKNIKNVTGVHNPNMTESIIHDIPDNFNKTDIVVKLIHSHSLIFNSTEKIQKILISNLIPIPAEFLAGYLTTTDTFGKKNVIFLGFFFMTICSALMIIFPDYLYLFSSGINFFIVFSFNITKLYTCLVYHTDNRDFAFGLVNCISRIISIFIPFISNFIMAIDLYGTCYVLLICSILGCLVASMLNENLCHKPIK